MDVWGFQGVSNVKMFINIFKIMVMDVFMQEWHLRLQNSTRSRFFITFAILNYKRYLHILFISKYRKSFSQLRLSPHGLEVEAGTWTKPNRIHLEDRKCKFCNTLEEEIPFYFKISSIHKLKKAIH